MTKLHHDECFQIYLDEIEEWLYVDWTGWQTRESVQRGCKQVLCCLQQTQATDILNDNSRVTGIWLEAAQWVAQQFFPAAAEIGLQKLAWVYGPGRLSQVSTDATIEHLPPEVLSIEVFYDLEEAKQWLRNYP